MATSLLTPERILRAVQHWLNTPVNGYLGSDYGNDLKSVLQTPFAAGLANAQIAKLRRDVPILQALPANAINLYIRETPPDKLDIILQVGALTFPYTGTGGA